ncbi:MAG: 4-phosphopantetheinyl transferase superfamily protein [Mucilaginibacter sp.]|jgi:phosphopantetheinyl transferase (holo-ACP synthase)|nr:4-phosphopantetheinyl transferase superfamily protein [Mucilaginibacter sp.]
MRSTGNDIVSLNAINKTRTKQSGFYSKILSPTEKNLYHESGFAKMPFETFVWLLWSLKESAFKYLQRINPELIFSPIKFAVNHLQLPAGNKIKNFEIKQTEGVGFKNMDIFKGKIIFGSDILYSISIINPEYIVSIVNGTENFENIGWGIKLIKNSDPNYQSIAVREFLIDKLKTVLQFDNLVIGKNQQGIPIVLKEGSEEETLPVSLSHHHFLVAYSYNFAV